VTLTRLVLAWLPVAVEFTLVSVLFGEPRGDPGATQSVRPLVQRELPWRGAEAAVVTLVASLWFDSLGHGGWWLLFVLLGVLVSLAQAPGTTAAAPRSPRDMMLRATRDTVRYVLAGAILAWRLG
jgi:hypothetical protein